MADSEIPPAGVADMAARGSVIPRGRMALLFMVMLVTAAGNTAMQSVMPSIGTDLGVADVWISAAYTWSAVLWMVMAPVWARRSDRRGRKAMMALGLVGFISSFALCGLVLWFGLSGALPVTLTLVLFAAARSLYGGFGSAAPPAVQAYVASRTARSERTRALALVASSFGLGTVIGPALAPLLVFDGLGLVGPFAIFSLIAAAVLVALRANLPDDTPSYAARGDVITAPFSAGSNAGMARRRDEDDDDDEASGADGLPTGTIPHLRWTDRRLRPWLIASLLGGHAQAALVGVIGFVVLDRLGLRGDAHAAAGPIGLVLMAGAISTLLAQWGLIPMLRMGPKTSTLWGAALAVVGTLLVGVAQDLHPIALGMAIASLGFGLLRPGVTAGSSLAVTRAEQGQIGGIIASVAGAAYIFAPILAVLFYGWHPWLSFGMIAALSFAVLVLGRTSLASDAALEGRD